MRATRSQRTIALPERKSPSLSLCLKCEMFKLSLRGLCVAEEVISLPTGAPLKKWLKNGVKKNSCFLRTHICMYLLYSSKGYLTKYLGGRVIYLSLIYYLCYISVNTLHLCEIIWSNATNCSSTQNSISWNYLMNLAGGEDLEQHLDTYSHPW